ncbi:hypothetical protein, conserved [Leishmania donovani]|uniref:Uncharacterized protein n=1 Tax=Leishmania donovani TaxID=5661 RepID=A0A3S5H6E7_LEIDO|nr:hypothetical protein, conserved [Leishmania donovani]AYU76581.1 hypothetical protein LdCL_090020400 [Leishmania donovani]TPP41654.1 hypothetical protein CGC21_36695 [Leishmania donovani]CBZ32098.1 hypothetical protein, conserved [Leishmania donovani]
MTRKVAAAAVLATAALLLLHTASFASVAAAAVSPTQVSSPPTAAQRQRLRSLAAYAERVGMALELFVGRHYESDTTDIKATASQFAEDSHLHPSAISAPMPSADRMPLLGFVTQCLQHPHIVVQSSVQSVMRFASAGRTLASVLVGASLDKDTEALLAKVEADADLHAEVGSDMAPLFVSPTNAHRTPAAIRQAARAVSTPPTKVAPLRQVFCSSIHQPAETLVTQPAEVTPLSCISGVNAYSSNAIVACRNSNDTYTAAEYVSLSLHEQEQCDGYISKDEPFTETCVCAQDYYMTYVNESSYLCRSRPLDVQILLEDKHLCFSQADVALGLPGTMEGEYCIKTNRNGTLQLPVTWKYNFLSDEAMLAASVFSHHVPPQVPQESEGLQWVVMSGSRPVMGNYSELSMSTDVFSYLVAGYAGSGQSPPSPNDVGFYLSASTELLSAAAFSAVFCFTSPRKTKDQLKEVPLKTESVLKQYLGNPDGVSSHSLTLDLSTVPNEFVEGNQMYVEVGLKGGPSIYYYRVARIHVSFTDLAEPPTNAHEYKKPLDPLYTLLIAAVSALVIGTGLAVLWYYCMQPDDYDDRLVSDAQRKKAQKHHPGVNSRSVD